MSNLPFGIDISRHQYHQNLVANLDFAKMKANTDFVFVKATEGWDYTDPTFVRNWQGVAEHYRGAYSYIWLNLDPLRQANHLIDTVAGQGANWLHDWLVLDLEKDGHGLSKAEVSRRVLVMMERIREVTGRYPILYSRKYWVQDNMLLSDPRLINALWWLANYRATLPYPLFTPEATPPPAMPNGAARWTLHQTSSRGKGSDVGVLSHYVDQNRFNGTKAELDAFFGRTEEGSEPEPEPEPLYSVRVNNIAPDRLNVRNAPNGTIVGKLHSGEIVSVWQVQNGWLRIGDARWVAERYTTRVDDEPEPPTPPVSTGYKYFNAIYNQRDVRWASHPLGTKSTIGANGCLMTCASMVANYFGHASNPLQLNNWLTANGGYLDGNLFLWAKIEELYPDMKFDGFVYSPTKAQIRTAITSGTLPMMYVDFDDTTPLIEMHWVLGIGMTDNDIIIADPWTGTIGLLSEMYAKDVIRYGSYRKVA